MCFNSDNMPSAKSLQDKLGAELSSEILERLVAAIKDATEEQQYKLRFDFSCDTYEKGEKINDYICQLLRSKGYNVNWDDRTERHASLPTGYNVIYYLDIGWD